MTTQQTVKTLLTETERLWLIAVQARRAAAAKQREYKAALLEWTEAETRRKQNER
jgi:hypothetical protein